MKWIVLEVRNTGQVKSVLTIPPSRLAWGAVLHMPPTRSSGAQQVRKQVEGKCLE